MKTITTYEDLVQDLIDNKVTMVRPDEFKTIFKSTRGCYKNLNHLHNYTIDALNIHSYNQLNPSIIKLYQY